MTKEEKQEKLKTLGGKDPDFFPRALKKADERIQEMKEAELNKRLTAIEEKIEEVDAMLKAIEFVMTMGNIPREQHKNND